MWQEWFQKILQHLSNLAGRFLNYLGQAVWEDLQEPLRKALTPKWVASIKGKRQQRQRAAEAAAEKRLNKVFFHEPPDYQLDDRRVAQGHRIPPPVELTFKDIYHYVKPPSLEWLAFATVSNLHQAHKWHRVFRVKSPNDPSFYKDFASLELIPERVIDEKSQQAFEVGPDLVTIVLKSD